MYSDRLGEQNTDSREDHHYLSQKLYGKVCLFSSLTIDMQTLNPLNATGANMHLVFILTETMALRGLKYTAVTLSVDVHNFPSLL